MPVAPFGSWPSPITADALVQRVVRLGQVFSDGPDVYWVEARPTEGGRQVLLRNGVEAVPADFSVRTLVHEYGGRAAAARGGVVWAVNLADQRLWRIAPDGAARPVTPEPHSPRAVRYADPAVSGDWVYCVRETHPAGGGEAVNEVVRVHVEGRAVEVVATGADFYAAPRPSPDGTRLAWLSWDHPDMPWDATTLWVGGPDGGGAQVVAGGASARESVSQPRWSPAGELHFLSDRTGWWNLYAEDGPEPLVRMEAEFGGPDWGFGQSTYAFLDDGTLVAAWQAPGRMRLGVVADGAVAEVGQPFTSLASLAPVPGGVVAVAGSPTTASCVARIGVPDGAVAVLARSQAVDLDPSVVSVPRPITFPTTEGDVAHALYYPPRNGDWRGPEGERPPLVVMSHGGPTAQASPVLSLGVQWWTSRGVAVVDVDYRGSSGYGRAYRQRLDGQWGVFDVDDCVAAAAWLAEQGEVDGTRTAIRGESASGLTTLCALTFRDAFAVGASHYGIGDIEVLVRETHKFESRYVDRLIGPYPEAVEVYRDRSPIHHAGRISAPVILFQGLEDKVVPPSQAALFADELRGRGVPFSLLEFEGEQHGWRRAETVKRVAEAELWFFGRVLGFVPADSLEAVAVEGPLE